MTSRRKGEMGRKQIDREYPHQVEIAIPPGGLGRTLDTLHAWAMGADLDYKTRSVRFPVDAMRWCFRDEASAEAFRKIWEDRRPASSQV